MDGIVMAAEAALITGASSGIGRINAYRGLKSA